VWGYLAGVGELKWFVLLIAVVIGGGCLQSDNFDNGSIEGFWNINYYDLGTGPPTVAASVTEVEGRLVVSPGQNSGAEVYQLSADGYGMDGYQIEWTVLPNPNLFDTYVAGYFRIVEENDALLGHHVYINYDGANYDTGEISGYWATFGGVGYYDAVAVEMDKPIYVKIIRDAVTRHIGAHWRQALSAPWVEMSKTVLSGPTPPVSSSSDVTAFIIDIKSEMAAADNVLIDDFIINGVPMVVRKEVVRKNSRIRQTIRKEGAIQ